MNKNLKNILVINFGGLGDEILFLPTIISLKKEFPKAKITLVLENRSKGITSLTDLINETITVDIKSGNFKKYTNLLCLLVKIWARHFDMVVSSGGNKLISIFLFLTFIKEKCGYNTGKLSEFLLTKAVPLNKNQYAARMYHDLIREITSINTELPEINVIKKNAEPNTVLIHPGVSLMSVRKGMIKTIPANIWAEVVDKLADRGKRVILAGGPDDKDVIEYISQKVSSDKYINMYGKTKNLKELAELIAKAEIFLCSDSAPLHIAVSLGIRTFAIFGSTDDKKLIPQNQLVTPIKSSDCNCGIQPCLWEHRSTTCETLDCLKITSDEIVEIVTKNI